MHAAARAARASLARVAAPSSRLAAASCTPYRCAAPAHAAARSLPLAPPPLLSPGRAHACRRRCAAAAPAASSVRAMAASAAPHGGTYGTGPLPDATWQQSMLRVKDPAPSLAFYRDVMGMTLVRLCALTRACTVHQGAFVTRVLGRWRARFDADVAAAARARPPGGQV
jgi:hypothetical protein